VRSDAVWMLSLTRIGAKELNIMNQQKTKQSVPRRHKIRQFYFKIGHWRCRDASNSTGSGSYSNIEEYLADYDGDGDVDSSDASCILAIIS